MTRFGLSGGSKGYCGSAEFVPVVGSELGGRDAATAAVLPDLVVVRLAHEGQ